MTASLAAQFAELAEKATQGSMYSGERVETAADACAFVDVRAEHSLADVAVARVVTKNNIYTDKSEEEAIANAAFIAFCFNNRTAIAQALATQEKKDESI